LRAKFVYTILKFHPNEVRPRKKRIRILNYLSIYIKNNSARKFSRLYEYELKRQATMEDRM